MADDDDRFPPEIQKSPTEFLFKAIYPIKAVISSVQPQYPTIRSNLLAVANIYGFVFVGVPSGIKVYSTSKLLEAAKAQKDHLDDCITAIFLRNSPNWISVSSNNLTLAVCCNSDKGPQILFFDMRNIANKSKATKTPFCSFALSKDPIAHVSSLHWNPSTDWPHLLAICLSTGSFHMLSVESKVTEFGIRPDDFGAQTVCWSPKGKQLVIGKSDGTLHQLTPKLEVRRSVSVTTVIDRPVRACDILWLSTYQFAASYVATDEQDDHFHPNLFLAHLPSKDENRDIIWRNFEDPCFGMNETYDPHYIMTFIDQWEMFIAFSSNSTDSTVIAKNKESQIWEIWTLDDSGRAGVPISPFTDDDSAPVGVALITTATERIVVDDTRECGPMPILLILTSDGILCPFHAVNLMKHYPNIVTQEQKLELARERKSSGNRGSCFSEAESPVTVVSTKQRLTAKPSVMSTSTLKQGLNLPPSALTDTSLPSHKTSTPFTKLPPFAVFDGSSIFPSNQTQQINPLLTRETPLKTASIATIKQPVLDETSVFDPNRTGSSEFVFTPTEPPKSQTQENQQILTGIIKQAFAPAKPVAITAAKAVRGEVLTSFANVVSTSKGVSLPPGASIKAPSPQITALTKQPKEPQTTATMQIPSVAPERVTKAGPTETGSFAKKKEMNLPKQSLSQKDSRGSSKGNGIIESFKRKNSRVSTVDSSTSLSWNTETMSEILSFEQELNDFISTTAEIDSMSEVFGSNEKMEIMKEMKAFSNFSLEISKNTQELNTEIQDTSTMLFESLSATESILRKQKMAKDSTCRAMLYKRPLELANQKKLKAIRALYEYIQVCVREANTALDIQWEKMHDHWKGISGVKRRELMIGEWETAYQALVINTKILHEQEVNITLLRQKLDMLHLYDTAPSRAQQSPLSSASEQSSKITDLKLLADTLLLKKDYSSIEDGERDKNKNSDHQKPGRGSAKISPKKQVQLGRILSNRKVTPVRASATKTSPSFVTKPLMKSRDSKECPAVSDSLSSHLITQARSSSGVLRVRESDPREVVTTPVKEDTAKSFYIEPKPASREATPSPTTTSDSASSLSNVEHEIVQEEPTPHPTFQLEPGEVFETPAVNNLKPQKLNFGTPLQGSSTRVTFSPIRDQTQKAADTPSPSVVPQGSATLAYGAPGSTPASNKQRIWTNFAACNTIEAASNLNNPPKVVNIQQMGDPEPPEANFPDKFEPKPEVPVGAIEVVQKVLETVKAEKNQQQPKEWPKDRTKIDKKPITMSVSTQPSESLSRIQPGESAFGSSTTTDAHSSLFASQSPVIPIHQFKSLDDTVVGEALASSNETKSPVVSSEPTSGSTAVTIGPLRSTSTTSGFNLQKSADVTAVSFQPPSSLPQCKVSNAKSIDDEDKSAGTTTSSVGLFGSGISTAAAQSSVGLFGTANTASTAVGSHNTTRSIFGTTETTTCSSSLFNVPSTTLKSGGLFGTMTCTSQSGSVFGLVAATSAATCTAEPKSSGAIFEISTPSGTGSFGSATTSAPSGDGLFGRTEMPIPSRGGLFGSTSKAPSDTGLFGGMTSAPLFGGGTMSAQSGGGLFYSATKAQTGTGFAGVSTSSSSFGGLFGSNTKSERSGDGKFGTVSTTSSDSTTGFGATNTMSGPFGSNSSVGGGFGQKAAFGQSVFGLATASPSQSGGIGGGLFSGLGGKPSEDAANTNPFEIGVDNQQQTQTAGGFGSSMFGNSGAKSFSSTSIGQSPQQTAPGFGDMCSGVGSLGFGGFSKPQSAGGFGAPAAFGSSPAFGSPPSFGSSLGRQFRGGGFESQHASGGGVFGQPSAEGSRFGIFANNETPGFGNLAQQTGGVFGSLANSQQQQQGAFGSGFDTNTQKSPSFSSWR